MSPFTFEIVVVIILDHVSAIETIPDIITLTSRVSQRLNDLVLNCDVQGDVTPEAADVTWTKDGQYIVGATQSRLQLSWVRYMCSFPL